MEEGGGSILPHVRVTTETLHHTSWRLGETLFPMAAQPGHVLRHLAGCLRVG